MAVKQAFMFPGQGSQQSGMGAELFERYQVECQLASQLLGYDIVKLCLDEDTTLLNQTRYTQPALYFVSCLAWLEYKQKHPIEETFFLGHSLGLYAALFAAGYFSLQTGLEIVAKRGALMDEVKDGAMLAVVGEGLEHIEDMLTEHEVYDVDVANYNSPMQVVLSGKRKGIDKLRKQLKLQGLRCVSLAVSGAFHSRYMESARQAFFDYLMAQDFATPTHQVISTTNAQWVERHFLLEELSFQLVQPVRWSQTIQSLHQRFAGIEYVEIGPGVVLTRLNNQIAALIGSVNR